MRVVFERPRVAARIHIEGQTARGTIAFRMMVYNLARRCHAAQTVRQRFVLTLLLTGAQCFREIKRFGLSLQAST